MEINYSLTENDYLQQQLYLASKSKFLTRQRKINNGAIIFVILLFGVILYDLTKDVFFLYILGGLLTIYACISSTYLKWAHKVTMKKYVDSTFLKRCGVIINLKFTDDCMVTSTSISDSKFKFLGFQNISEIEDYFLITLKTDENIIIPKSHLENIEAFRNKLKTISEELKIEFTSELDWKWK